MAQYRDLQPLVVAGLGLGELAAAWAAGVFSLEDGLRLAAARIAPPQGQQAQQFLTDLDPVLSGLSVSAPLRTLVSGISGQVVESTTVLDHGNWLHAGDDPAAVQRCVEALSNLKVQLLVEIDSRSTFSPTEDSYGAEPAERAGIGTGSPRVVVSLGSQSGIAPSSEASDALTRAAATLYEDGLPVSFAGLFAGETRRRISLPDYPFQRKNFWFRPLERQAPDSST